MGFYRLIGVDVSEPTKQFLIDPDHPGEDPVEQIPDDSALIAHAARISATRIT